MKNDRIAVALLGAGRIGQEHAKNLAAFPQVEVVVVCDPRIEGAEALRPLVRAKDITPSPEEAVNRNDVDAVIICTPTDTHAGLIEAAAEGGKAIFCEKPVALDLRGRNRRLPLSLRKGWPFKLAFSGVSTQDTRKLSGGLRQACWVAWISFGQWVVTRLLRPSSISPQVGGCFLIRAFTSSISRGF